MVTPAFAAPPVFCDVTAGDPFFTAVTQLAARQIIKGYDVVKKMEAVGSRGGPTSAKVVIENCGVVDAAAARLLALAVLEFTEPPGRGVERQDAG